MKRSWKLEYQKQQRAQGQQPHSPSRNHGSQLHDFRQPDNGYQPTEVLSSPHNRFPWPHSGAPSDDRLPQPHSQKNSVPLNRGEPSSRWPGDAGNKAAPFRGREVNERNRESYRSGTPDYGSGVSGRWQPRNLKKVPNRRLASEERSIPAEGASESRFKNDSHDSYRNSFVSSSLHDGGSNSGNQNEISKAANALVRSRPIKAVSKATRAPKPAKTRSYSTFAASNLLVTSKLKSRVAEVLGKTSRGPHSYAGQSRVTRKLPQERAKASTALRLHAVSAIPSIRLKTTQRVAQAASKSLTGFPLPAIMPPTEHVQQKTTQRVALAARRSLTGFPLPAIMPPTGPVQQKITRIVAGFGHSAEGYAETRHSSVALVRGLPGSSMPSVPYNLRFRTDISGGFTAHIPTPAVEPLKPLARFGSIWDQKHAPALRPGMRAGRGRKVISA